MRTTARNDAAPRNRTTFAPTGDAACFQRPARPADQEGVANVDVAVVGNGVLGLSTAVEAARRAPGLRVAVVGPPDRPGAASAAAGAMLNCFGEVTRHTGRHPAARAKFAFAREALDRWPAWLDRLADDAGPEVGGAALDSHVPGTVVVLGGGAGTIAEENFAALRRAAEECREPHDLLDAADVPGLAPAAHARPRRALHLHREGCLDARAVLAALEEAARRRGVALVPDTVREVVAGSGAVRGVRLATAACWGAGSVVLAAGSTSGDLATGVLPAGAMPPCCTVRDRRCCSGGPGPAAPPTSCAPPTAARAAGCTSCRCPRRDGTTSARPTSSPATSRADRPSARPRR